MGDLYYCHAGHHETTAPFIKRKGRRMCMHCVDRLRGLLLAQKHANSGYRRDDDKDPTDGKEKSGRRPA